MRAVAAAAQLILVALAAAAVAGLGPSRADARPVTFAAAADAAVETLLGVYYTGDGRWRACNASDCPAGNVD
jgi:hypothetical protein